MTTLLAQISDLHITRAGQLLAGRVDTAAYLARCVARLRTLAPDAVLVTGDLVERGAADEYARLRDLLAPLPMPVYLMLGNHDDRAAFRTVFGDAAYLRDTAEHVQYAVDAGELRILALDSNDPTARGGGRLGPARLGWLARALDAARARPVVVAIHHPPFATGVVDMDACGLHPEDTAALADLVRPHGNVERIICGHLHRAMTCRFAGTIASTAPSAAHQVALDFAPDVSVNITLEPPALVLHRYTPTAGLVSHHVYVDTAERFGFGG